jgi:D-amino-acid dehydrogenase
MPLTTPGALRSTWRALFDKDAAIYIPPRFDPSLWMWLTRFAVQCLRSNMMEVAAARHVLLQSSMALFRQLLADESIDVEWNDRGLLFVYRSNREFEAFERTAELLRREFDIPMSAFAGAELARLEPALRADLAGGWYCPGDAHLRPDRLMSAMSVVLRRLGVEIVEQTEVSRILVTNGQAIGVNTSRGEMTCQFVVLAAGAETTKFARQLGCRIPIQPGKGYSITMPRPCPSPEHPMILEESHVGVTPWKSGLRIGSTMEFAGYDRRINPRRIELFRRAVAEHFVEPPAGPVEEEWSGWRPMTYDELPCIGRAPRVGNVLVAAGHGMLGISTMMSTGKLVSELALEMEPHLDPIPYALTRFDS